MVDFGRSTQIETKQSLAPNIHQPVLPIAGDLAASTIEIGGAPRSLANGTGQQGEVIAEKGRSIDERVGDAYSQDQNDKRLEAIAELGGLRNPRAELTLVSLLDDHDPTIREAAVEALGALGSGPAIQGLGYALSDAMPSIRRSAIEMLADIGSDDAIYALTMTLSDGDPAVREAAVYELADIDSSAALGLLQQFFSDDDPKIGQLAWDLFDKSGTDHVF